MIKETESLLTLLQLCDSGFPTGGFSHSVGLEAATQANLINNKESLYKFLVCCLENTGSFSLPFVTEAHHLATDVTTLSHLDDVCEACTANHVAKRASTRQGKSLLDTAGKVFKLDDLTHLKKLPNKHQTVVFGAMCRHLGIDLHSTQAAFLFTTIRTVISSAVRMNSVGPIEAQSIQVQIQGQIPDVIERNKQRTSEDACLVFPHIDIVQNTHDTMFSKLFYS